MSFDVSSRQRLRPWLEAKINSGQIQGLKWIDKEQHIFKVPWKHGGKHDWNEQDSQIFKEWAMHTGRFRQGVDDPDYPTWKTRFRCALNKLPDIQEVKDLSKLDGPDPFRAYRFMPRKDMAHMQRIQMPSNGGNIQQQLSNTSSLPDILNDVRDNEQRSPENLPSDLNDIDVSQFIGSQQMKTEPIENMDTSTDAIGYTGQLVLNHDRCSEDPMSLLHTTHGLPMSPPLHSNTPPEMNKMRIKLRYRREEVAEHVVTNPLGCRLFYGPRIDQMTNQFNKEIYGPDGVDLLHFPLCLNMINNQKQEELTIKLLDVLDRGLMCDIFRFTPKPMEFH
ncbi:hypothetical protein KUTeg_019984 [Tegillarca granosa]|uniref:IRF tryptophan pentad repeat domain-containing protein n=1 Tax=Tegillarca granosa TaxID=220873 RepID=A0ABQ9EE59_TEGGR|nr:hypothetical protein KUTeg_019984 [Tegillarca granosa]